MFSHLIDGMCLLLGFGVLFNTVGFSLPSCLRFVHSDLLEPFLLSGNGDFRDRKQLSEIPAAAELCFRVIMRTTDVSWAPNNSEWVVK